MKKKKFFCTFAALMLFAGMTVSCGDDAVESGNPSGEGGSGEGGTGGTGEGSGGAGEGTGGAGEGSGGAGESGTGEGGSGEGGTGGTGEGGSGEGGTGEGGSGEGGTGEGGSGEGGTGEGGTGEGETPKPVDKGPVVEPEADTDDSDVLDGVELPKPGALPDDPCLKCTVTEECVNHACVTGTRHSVSVSKAFTDEAGDKATFSVYMTRNPASDITFKCWIESTSPVPEAKIECSGKIDKGDFTVGAHSSYTSTRYVTVTGLPDNIDDGDQRYYVMLQTVSDDPYFDGVIHSPMEFTNRNVDHAGVSWHAEETLLTSEEGMKATYTMQLTSKPLAPVKLKLRSSDLTEGTVEPKALVFTPDNWNVPQNVTVSGVDDEFEDGAINYSILTSTVSADPKYNEITVPDISITNIDNDKASVTLSARTYKLMPDEKTKVGITLSTKPAADVHITLAKSTAMITYDREEIVFTPENWSEPQYFEFNYNNPDKAKEAITTYCFAAVMVSEDDAYSMKMSNTKCLDLYRYKTLDIEYTGKEEAITLLPGEYSLQVWGAQGSGSLNSLGGYGGYSHGTVEFKQETVVYVNVGGIPYNGGGPAQAPGGGATHMATVSGLLSTLSDKRDQVLIVAGGGGGSERVAGGYGGGEVGGTGAAHGTYTTVVPLGGTQTEGGMYGTDKNFGVGTQGTFGQGGNGIGQLGTTNGGTPYMDQGGGGGGGWYGGGGVPYAGGGGGGSGHIGKGVKGETIAGDGTVSFESPTGGTELGHGGTGFARISIVERPPTVIF